MKLWFSQGAWANKHAASILNSIQPETVTRIAVIRHAALGDMVLTRPFLHELRKTFPNAHVTLSLVSNYMIGVPDDLVDQIHVLPGKDKNKGSWKAQIRALKTLGNHDLIFDLAATSRSFWLCIMNKAKLKIGFPYRAMQRKLIFDIAIYRSELHFEADILLDMLKVIGVKTDYPPLFKMQRIEQGKPIFTEKYIAYFTSASLSLKCWPKARFIELLKKMAAEYPGYKHVILEGSAEWESVEPIKNELGHMDEFVFLSRRSLSEVTAVLQNSELLICNDTGIRNLAIACETKTLGLFFHHDNYRMVPFRYWPRYGEHDIALRINGGYPSVDEVFSLAKKQLSNLQINTIEKFND